MINFVYRKQQTDKRQVKKKMNLTECPSLSNRVLEMHTPSVTSLLSLHFFREKRVGKNCTIKKTKNAFRSYLDGKWVNLIRFQQGNRKTSLTIALKTFVFLLHLEGRSWKGFDQSVTQHNVPPAFRLVTTWGYGRRAGKIPVIILGAMVAKQRLWPQQNWHSRWTLFSISEKLSSREWI